MGGRSLEYDNSLIIDSAGNPIISYPIYENNNDILKIAWWNGSIWETQTLDSCDASTDPSLILDSSGNPALSYFQGNDDLMYARWNGASWDIEIVDSTANGRLYSSLSFDSNGNPAISYYVNVLYSSPAYELRIASFNGSNWDIQMLDSADSGVIASSLAFNDEGMPCIAYEKDEGGDRVLKYIYWYGVE